MFAGAVLSRTGSNEMLSASLFSDVPTGHSVSSAAAYLTEQGLLEGYSDGTFRPTNPVNRAEIAKIIAIIAERKGYEKCLPFSALALHSDVPADAWYAPHICTAKQAGFVQGYPDGTFRPAQIVSFAEAAKMVVVSLGGEGLRGDPWYEPYVKALADRSAIPLSVDRLDMPLRRGDLAEILYRVFANITDSPSHSSEEILAPLHGSAPASLSAVLTELLEMVNASRVSAGFQPLIYNASLSRAAQDHAEDMNIHNYYDHVSSDGKSTETRIYESGYFICRDCGHVVGETIAKAHTVEKAFNMWMNSSQHKEYILSQAFQDIGLGNAGQVYVLTLGALR